VLDGFKFFLLPVKLALQLLRLVHPEIPLLHKEKLLPKLCGGESSSPTRKVHQTIRPEKNFGPLGADDF